MNRMTFQPPRALDRLAMDPAPADAPTGPLIPMIIGCALLMQVLDGTVIMNALPTMARSLHEDVVTLNLAITAYLLASAVFLPISGWAADRFGAKRVFTTAIVVFAVSSLGCGICRNLPELVAARMVQGLAGAMMAPVGRVVLLRSVPKSDLVRAMSWLTIPAMLGPVLGPPLGGFIVTYASWRWIFFINLPIGVLGVVLVSLFIPDIREDSPPKLDVAGFVLSGFGLAGLVYGFENLGRGMLPFKVVAAMLLGGAVCLWLFTRHARRTPDAILDLSLLRIPTFTSSTVGGAFLRMGMGASPFLLALLLQVGFGMSAFGAGLMTFASGSGALVMKIAARPVIDRIGFKRVLVGNTLITTLAFFSYCLFRSDTPIWIMVGLLLVGGFFRSLQFTALNALAYADIDQAQMSRASSLSSMGQQLSQSIGIGLAAILLEAVRGWRGDASAHLVAGDVWPAFVAIGVLNLASLFFFLPLPASAGAELSGRRGPGPVRASRSAEAALALETED
jgi:EmrB/QacA subfamily drug resistance transporter